jgi:hypothetical protein
MCHGRTPVSTLIAISRTLLSHHSCHNGVHPVVVCVEPNLGFP